MPACEALDPSELDRMRLLFLERMNDDFGEFTDCPSEYSHQERAYKDEFGERTRDELRKEVFRHADSAAGARAIIETTLALLQKPLSTIEKP